MAPLLSQIVKKILELVFPAKTRYKPQSLWHMDIALK